MSSALSVKYTGTVTGSREGFEDHSMGRCVKKQQNFGYRTNVRMFWKGVSCVMKGVSTWSMNPQTLMLLRSIDMGISGVTVNAFSSGVFVVGVSVTVTRYFSGRSLESICGFPV